MASRRTMVGLFLLITLAAPAGAENRQAGKSVFHDLGEAGRRVGYDAGRFVTSPARIDRESALTIGGIAAVGGILFLYDQEILNGLERSRGNQLYDFVIDTGESIGDAGHSGKTFPFYLGGIVLGYLVGSEPLETISAELLEYQIIPGLLRNVLKEMVGRKRPEEDHGPRSFKFGGGQSTPSGHAANIFSLATVIAHRVDYLPVTIAGYSLATCVSLERVDSGAHWPSDVFLGAVYGLVCTRYLLKLHDQNIARLEPMMLSDRAIVGVGIRYRF